MPMKTKGDKERYKPNHCFICSVRNDAIANRNQFFESVTGIGSTLNVTDSHPSLQDCPRRLKKNTV